MSEQVEETTDKEQTPSIKIRTRSKIPNSLREEVMNQRGGAKTISDNRADLADPVFALGGEEGRKSQTFPENYGVDQGLKLYGVKGLPLWENLGESVAKQDQGSSAEDDIRETQESQASVDSESVSHNTLETKSTEEEEGVLRDQELPWNPSLEET